jgi:hypothetical protein
VQNWWPVVLRLPFRLPEDPAVIPHLDPNASGGHETIGFTMVEEGVEMTGVGPGQ